MAKKANRRNKPPTSERYFEAIQQDLLAIRKDMDAGFRAVREAMATKQELAEVRVGMKDLRADLKTVTEVMVSKADLEAVRQELLREIRGGQHVEELRERLTIVERRLGIGKPRRAA